MNLRNKKIVAALELAARFYLAYVLIEYGAAKLTGSMFNNASQEILNTPLQKVDLFHLTWYWFYKNKLLTCFVGIIQIVSAILLLFNRTVLPGVILAFPVLFSIFLIDIYCVGSPALVMRVFFYNFLLLGFALYRWHVVRNAFGILVSSRGAKMQGSVRALLWPIAGAIVLILLLEVLLIKGIALFSN